MTGNEYDFVGEFETKRANDGYGLVMDKGTAEKQKMAEVFNAPDVGTMDTTAEEEEPAAPALDVPAESETPTAGEVATADSLGEGETIVGSADPVVGGPIAESAVKGEALPAAEPVKGMSFGEAFKKYRAAGKKDFPWTNPKTGKTSIYSTALKSEKAKPLPKAAPVAAPAEEPTPQAIAVEVFRLQDEPAPATGPARSTGGIGPDLNPAMQPKPGAKGIYANVGVSAPQKQVAPINVTGKDGNARPAESVAEVMAARKGARGG